MNAEQLLAHYERIAEAPDAIARLRRFVLDLAVRGKLVEQNSADKPAIELVRAIKSEKNTLIESRSIRREKPLPSIRDAEFPFEIPSAWAWARLGDLCELVTSGSRDWAKHYASDGAIFVRMGNLSKGDYRLRLDSIQHVRPPVSGEGTRTRLEGGDILISITGDVGMLGLIPENFGEAYINQHVALVRPMSPIKGRYLPELFRSDFAQDQFNEPQRGIKNSFRLTDITQFLVPVPPLSEQQRIVAKVDELMALCDRLEEARKEREAARDRLTAASLARLNAPGPNLSTFTTHARFALDNLPILTSQHRQIAQWRATIIELATRGKLSTEDPRDTLPSKALEAISEARDALVRIKELRREKPLAAIHSKELPFPAPNSWAWVRLGDVALFTQYGTSLKAEQTTAGVPVLTMGNIQSGAVVSAKEKRIPSQSPELPELYVKRLDLLYNRTNSPELVGKTGIYVGDDDRVTFASYLIRLRFLVDHTDPHFINLAMNAPGFRSSQIAPYIKQQTGQANVNGTAMKNMLIALPPVEEQRRIVATVDELMALCDRLETCLITGDETRQSLLEAVLHEALEPAQVRELEAA